MERYLSLYFLIFFYLVVSGLGCGRWDLSLWCRGSAVVACELICSVVWGNLSSSTGTEAVFPALQGRFLTIEPPEKSPEISVALSNLLQVCIFLSH